MTSMLGHSRIVASPSLNPWEASRVPATPLTTEEQPW
ncbi:hypothetical protein Lsed01_00555 [Demequina sediminis]|uniref:Uncharacterized protein n=1 Tax=Demequina sediminis TaxID=1930058 RepID=A0ABP9WE63_9MICO